MNTERTAKSIERTDNIVQAAPQPARRVPAAASPGGEKFVISGHSGFVGSLSPTAPAGKRGGQPGRVGGVERGVVGATG